MIATPSVPEGYAAIEDAKRIGNVSEKTIRNWAAKRLIGAREHKRPGITPIKVYRISDIERESGKKQVEVLVPATPVAPISTAVEVHGSLAQRFSEAFNSLHDTAVNTLRSVEELRRVVESEVSAPRVISAERKHLLTIKEACSLGYSRKWLRSMLVVGSQEFEEVIGFGLHNLGSTRRPKVSRFELERLAGKRGAP